MVSEEPIVIARVSLRGRAQKCTTSDLTWSQVTRDLWVPSGINMTYITDIIDPNNQ